MNRTCATWARLRKLLPITAGTFIVGWLAIAGVPPFSGFWSKDDILLYAFDYSRVLWAIGFVTALLTAYYMTRQVMMVFYGEAHWKEARPGGGGADHDAGAHAAEPHESPWLMWVPLVVLAIGAALVGVINLPFEGRDYLHNWLEPVVEGSERTLGATAEDYKWVLLGLAAVVALLGLLAGYLVYERRRLKPLEPAILAHGWYYDQAVSSFMGGPGQAGFEATADLRRQGRSTARWTAPAHAVRAARERLRHTQTGYVRNYALGIGVGAVLLLGWFVARGSDVMDGFPLLTAIIVLPAIGAVVTALLPRSRPELVRPVAVSFTVGTLALTVSLLASFEIRRGRLPVHDLPLLDRAVGDRAGTSAWTASRCSSWS